jgi:nucleotide-binding universal stress UspA family protein
MYRSIVVPVDLAEPDISRHAIDRAVALAKLSDGRITLVNVVPIMPVMMLDTVPVSYETEVADKSRIAMEELARSVALPSGRVSSVVRIGGVYHEVLEVATETGADLIVVGSHRPAMATYLLGSNATAIVRHATSSVLVVLARPLTPRRHQPAAITRRRSPPSCRRWPWPLPTSRPSPSGLPACQTCRARRRSGRRLPAGP